MLYIDAPYGLGYEEWDKKAFDLQDYKSIFKQMEAITSMENWIAVVWTARDHGSIVVQAMLEQGFKATQEICWYKFNQNQEGTQNLVNSLEHCTIGFKEGRKSVPWFMSANPSERHNLAVGGTQRLQEAHFLCDRRLQKNTCSSTRSRPSQSAFRQRCPALVLPTQTCHGF